MEVCKKELCTSCGVCVNVCPTKCIELITDINGNLKFNVNLKKCTNCDACKKHCPNNNLPEMHFPYKSFAASNTKTTLKDNIASGGIARALYEKFLEEGARVVGTTFHEGEFSYVITDNLENIDDFGNSKYVRCKSVNIYPQVKETLKNGRKVLFIGLPCQVAGLKKYLGETNENLITVDLLCHGAPEQQYLYECLGKKKVNARSRFRKLGEYKLITESKKGKIKTRKANKSSYLLSFIKGINLSESCYSCQYARGERVGDITIGDFWGVDDLVKDKFINKIVSCVLINTAVGENAFLSLNDIQFTQVDFEQIRKNNRPLNNPQHKTRKRVLFEKLYPLFGYKITMLLIGIYWNIAFNAVYDLYKDLKNSLRKGNK